MPGAGGSEASDWKADGYRFGTKEAGQNAQPSSIECVLERETGLEPATLCLGSTLVGWPDRIGGQEVGQEWGDFGPFSLLQIRRVGRCPWWRS